jgi:hypothetical protein
MVMHPGMDRLQALGTGELDRDEHRRTAEHVATCPRCRETAEWIAGVRAVAREEVAAPSPGAWDMIAARVAAQDAVLLPMEPAAPAVRTRASAPWLKAAVLVLLLAAGAAGAMPGGWLRSAVESLTGHSAGPDAISPGVGAGADGVSATPVPPVVLFVEPAAGGVHVTLERPNDAVRIHVQLIDSAELEVRALDGAAGATFRTSPGRLDIVGAAAGSVMLGVPVGLARIRIDVDGRTLLLKENGQLRVLAPGVDTVGAEYILPVRAARMPAGLRQEN